VPIITKSGGTNITGADIATATASKLEDELPLVLRDPSAVETPPLKIRK
jgi:hypothetical protein